MLQGYVTLFRYYTHGFVIPIIVNDDKSMPTDEFLASYNYKFSQISGQNGGVENPVNHIKVSLPLLTSPSGSTPFCGGGSLSAKWIDGPSYPNKYRAYKYDSYLNGFRGHQYEYQGRDDPGDSDIYIDTTWTLTRIVNNQYVIGTSRQVRSDAYCALHGCSKTAEDLQYICYFQKALSPYDAYFSKAFFSDKMALDIYNSIAYKHICPSGLLSECFRSAMNSITCNTNTIANIADGIELMKDIKSGKVFEAIKDFKDSSLVRKATASWMTYRYSYNTTKSDIQEYSNKLGKALSKTEFNQPTICRSGASTEAGTFHCKVTYSDRYHNGVMEAYKDMKRLGLALDAYNAWDMVPMSFVIDWFLPVGDYLEDFSSNWVANTQMFDIQSIVTSWKWSEDVDAYGLKVHVSSYSRSVSNEPPEFESYSEDPSTGTVIRRIIDGACMIVG